MLAACGLVRDPDSDAIWWTVPYMRHGPYRGTRCRFFGAVRWPNYMLRLWHCEASILLLLLLPRHKGVHMPQVDHQLVARVPNTFCLPQPLVGRIARSLVEA